MKQSRKATGGVIVFLIKKTITPPALFQSGFSPDARFEILGNENTNE